MASVPAALRMYQSLIVLRLVIIQHRRKDFIFHLDETEGFVHAFLIFSRDNGDHVPHKTDVAVDDQPVPGTGLRLRLAGQSKAAPVLGNVLPGEDCLDPGHLLRDLRADLLHDGIGVGRVQDLHDQAVLRRQVIRVDRLPRQKLFRVLFPERLADGLQISAEFRLFRRTVPSFRPHSSAPSAMFPDPSPSDSPPGSPDLSSFNSPPRSPACVRILPAFFQARYACIPRSCPS